MIRSGMVGNLDVSVMALKERPPTPRPARLKARPVDAERSFRHSRPDHLLKPLGSGLRGHVRGINKQVKAVRRGQVDSGLHSADTVVPVQVTRAPPTAESSPVVVQA